jgi:hypothetical protein
MNSAKFFFYIAFLLLIKIDCKCQFTEENISGMNSEFGSDVVTKLLIEDDESMGLITYFSRNSKKVCTQFFSYDRSSSLSAYSKYLAWKKGKNVIMLTSAGFSQSLDYPSCAGICIDDGKIISSSFDNTLDGLFFITPYVNYNGDIVTINLEQDYGKMTIDGKVVYPKLTPSRFISEVQDVKATLFQSQLFYYNDTPFYSWPKKEENYAPRRFFIAAYKSGLRYDIIISIPYNAPLTSYVYKSYKFITSKGFSVHSFFNLDTGWYDFYRLYSDFGQNYYVSVKDRNGHHLSMKGERDNDISRATNFMVFYYQD